MDSMRASSVPNETFKGRRRRAFDVIGEGALVLPAAPVQHASRDTERPYVPDRELYYLTGLTEPQTVAVLVGGTQPRVVLFVRERDPDAELWAGPRLGLEGARATVEPDECRPLSDLEHGLGEILRGADTIFYRLGRGGPVEAIVLSALAHARARGARKGSGPRVVVDPGEVLDDLRLIKDETEISALREACAVTVIGHRAGAAAVAPGAGEWVVEAAVNGAFRRSGATRPGFDTIVGSGANGCVLHYVDNRDVVEDGDLVLVDAGAEVGLYHGDVTRTYPASGAFTPAQRDIYELVEAARRAAVSASLPGASIGSVHEAAARVLVEGLKHHGVLRGEVDGLLEQEAHKPYFPHQTSHWLGLDVHDVGDYVRDGVSRALAPGMVFTVEPGLYFRPGIVQGPADAYAGIGIRIEDDVLVTDSGPEVLTSDLPTDPDAVEGLVGGGLAGG